MKESENAGMLVAMAFAVAMSVCGAAASQPASASAGESPLRVGVFTDDGSGAFSLSDRKFTTLYWGGPVFEPAPETAMPDSDIRTFATYASQNIYSFNTNTQRKAVKLLPVGDVVVCADEDAVVEAVSQALHPSFLAR